MNIRQLAARFVGVIVGLATCTAASASTSMVGTWEGRWYYSDSVVWLVPPTQSSYQMDLVVTSETANLDGTSTLVGHMDFFYPDNVLSQGPNAWDVGTKNGFALSFTNVAHYDYNAVLNFAGNQMTGLWYPSFSAAPDGVTPGCTPTNVTQAYCGGFDLHLQSATVPEPATLGLLSIGLVCLGLRRRR